MRSLCFLARRFTWTPFQRTVDDAEADPRADASDDALVAFLHVEVGDIADPVASVRKTIKHLKWIANKREVKNVVLHSFTHLGGESAEAKGALELLCTVRDRL